MKHFKIGTKSVPVDFCMAAHYEIADAISTGANAKGEYEAKMTFTNMARIAHIGIFHGYRKKGDKYAGTLYDTFDLLEQREESLTEIMVYYNEVAAQKGGEKEGKPSASRKRRSK